MEDWIRRKEELSTTGVRAVPGGEKSPVVVTGSKNVLEKSTFRHTITGFNQEAKRASLCEIHALQTPSKDDAGSSLVRTPLRRNSVTFVLVVLVVVVVVRRLDQKNVSYKKKKGNRFRQAKQSSQPCTQWHTST